MATLGYDPPIHQASTAADDDNGAGCTVAIVRSYYLYMRMCVIDHLCGKSSRSADTVVSGHFPSTISICTYHTE